MQHTATHCNILHHASKHCNTLQHTAPHCNTLHHTATPCNALQHRATHCNTVQRTASHLSTLQHTTTHCNILYTDDQEEENGEYWQICVVGPIAAFILSVLRARCCLSWQRPWLQQLCCSVLQCVAVWSSVLQRVAACCRVLQCFAGLCGFACDGKGFD